jgi:hypothetical protein
MEAQQIRCICKQSDGIDDWFCIYRAEHDGRRYLEPCDFGMGAKGTMLIVTARLGEGKNNYDIEGTGEEMLAIADAITNGGSARFTRCAAVTTESGVELDSPRNSLEPVCIAHECAKELAESIRSVVNA